MVVSLLAAFWVLATFGAFIEGWKRRASDLVLGPTGCEIRGGPLHGTQHRWDELDPAFCQLVVAPPAALGAQTEDSAALVIQGEIAALSQDPAEDRSLQSIVHTLHGAARGGHRQRAPEGSARLQVVCCTSCGAPVPPRESGVCPYCGAAVILPAPVLRQLHAQSARDRERATAENLLRRVLRQPRALATNVWLVLLLPPLLLSWPVAGAVFDEFYQLRHVLRPYHGLALAAAALCGNLALQFLLRAQVAARVAVRIIATHFAALPPDRPGAGPGCRICGAPLVPKSGALLLLCVYCGAENITGLNLIPVAAAQAAQAGRCVRPWGCACASDGTGAGGPWRRWSCSRSAGWRCGQCALPCITAPTAPRMRADVPPFAGLPPIFQEKSATALRRRAVSPRKSSIVT